MRWRRTRAINEEKGQSTVEFALILPMLVLLVFGALEIGRVMNAWLIVTQASREGARVAAISCSSDTGCLTQVLTRVDGSLSGLNSASARTTLLGSPYVSGNAVTVQVQYDIPLITPLIGAFFPANPFTVSGSTTMRLE